MCDLAQQSDGKAFDETSPAGGVELIACTVHRRKRIKPLLGLQQCSTNGQQPSPLET
jgi:hypothetical protein